MRLVNGSTPGRSRARTFMDDQEKTMFSNLGFSELAMILTICVVLFGAKRIPEIGASVGKGIREFKRGVSEIGDATGDE
jgi:sec-independent protein translocase protein TatA